jgi:hypothetical protein
VKADAVVKGVVEAAIRRHSSEIDDWPDTRFWDPADATHQGLASHLALDDGEIPIICSVVGPKDWTLFTTRAVELNDGGRRGRVALSDITDVHPGNFKGYHGQESERLILITADGTTRRCPYRTGKESMGTLYALNTLRRVGPGGPTRS